MNKKEMIKKYNLTGNEIVLIWQNCEFEMSANFHKHIYKYMFEQIWIPAKEDSFGYDALEDNDVLRFIDKKKVVNEMLKKDYTLVDLFTCELTDEIFEEEVE